MAEIIIPVSTPGAAQSAAEMAKLRAESERLGQGGASGIKKAETATSALGQAAQRAAAATKGATDRTVAGHQAVARSAQVAGQAVERAANTSGGAWDRAAGRVLTAAAKMAAATVLAEKVSKIAGDAMNRDARQVAANAAVKDAKLDAQRKAAIDTITKAGPLDQQLQASGLSSAQVAALTKRAAGLRGSFAPGSQFEFAGNLVDKLRRSGRGSDDIAALLGSGLDNFARFGGREGYGDSFADLALGAEVRDGQVHGDLGRHALGYSLRRGGLATAQENALAEGIRSGAVAVGSNGALSLSDRAARARREEMAGLAAERDRELREAGPGGAEEVERRHAERVAAARARSADLDGALATLAAQDAKSGRRGFHLEGAHGRGRISIQGKGAAFDSLEHVGGRAGEATPDEADSYDLMQTWMGRLRYKQNHEAALAAGVDPALALTGPLTDPNGMPEEAPTLPLVSPEDRKDLTHGGLSLLGNIGGMYLLLRAMRAAAGGQAGVVTAGAGAATSAAARTGGGWMARMMARAGSGLGLLGRVGAMAAGPLALALAPGDLGGSEPEQPPGRADLGSRLARAKYNELVRHYDDTAPFYKQAGSIFDFGGRDADLAELQRAAAARASDMVERGQAGRPGAAADIARVLGEKLDVVIALLREGNKPQPPAMEVSP